VPRLGVTVGDEGGSVRMDHLADRDLHGHEAVGAGGGCKSQYISEI